MFRIKTSWHKRFTRPLLSARREMNSAAASSGVDTPGRSCSQPSPPGRWQRRGGAGRAPAHSRPAGQQPGRRAGGGASSNPAAAEPAEPWQPLPRALLRLRPARGLGGRGADAELRDPAAEKDPAGKRRPVPREGQRGAAQCSCGPVARDAAPEETPQRILKNKMQWDKHTESSGTDKRKGKERAAQAPARGWLGWGWEGVVLTPSHWRTRPRWMHRRGHPGYLGARSGAWVLPRSPQEAPLACRDEHKGRQLGRQAGGEPPATARAPAAPRALTSKTPSEDGKQRGDAKVGFRGLWELPVPERAEHEA